MPRLLALLFVVTVGSVRLAQWFDRFAVAERSMEPALSDGDFVVTSRDLSRIAPGDVIVFRHPERAGFWLTKRVIATGGDTVEIGSGDVRRNARPIDGPLTPGSGVWTLAADELFVLGDNRHVSSDDSRMLGPIPIGQVDGVCVARYWPLRSIGLIRRAMPPSAGATSER